jgi:hypothetical protein
MLLRVSWRDAYFDFTETETRPDYLVTTVGEFLRIGRFLTLAAEALPDGEHRAITHIPRESVVAIESLEPAGRIRIEEL